VSTEIDTARRIAPRIEEMTMRNRMIGLCVFVLAAAGYAQPSGPPHGGMGGRGGPGGFLGGEVLAPGRVVKNAAFSGDVVTQTTQTLADGSHIKQSTTVHVYRDSEGRTRREETLNLNGLAVGANNGVPPQMVFLNDPVAGTSYALDTTNRTATKTGRGPWQRAGAVPGSNSQGPTPRMVQGRVNREPQNAKTESLGSQMIEGVQAQGTRITRTIPAGQIGNEQPIQIVTESWYSTDLQMVVLRKSSDPRRGETVTQLTNVSRGEPSSTLFQVPADYKVSEGPRGRAPRQ
jgi:hypothetical protein